MEACHIGTAALPHSRALDCAVPDCFLLCLPACLQVFKVRGRFHRPLPARCLLQFISVRCRGFRGVAAAQFSGAALPPSSRGPPQQRCPAALPHSRPVPRRLCAPCRPTTTPSCASSPSSPSPSSTPWARWRRRGSRSCASCATSPAWTWMRPPTPPSGAHTACVCAAGCVVWVAQGWEGVHGGAGCEVGY